GISNTPLFLVKFRIVQGSFFKFGQRRSALCRDTLQNLTRWTMTRLLFDVSFVQSIPGQVRRISSSVSMISIVGLSLALVPPAVQAATFSCASGDVQCLIIAINQANANLQPENTIHLEAGTYTLTNIDNNTDGPNGLPSITSTLTIDAAANKTAT